MVSIERMLKDIRDNAFEVKDSDATLVLFRGLNGLDLRRNVKEYKIDEFLALKPGDIFELKAPASFSSRGDIVKYFSRADTSRSDYKGDNMIIEFHVHKGGRAVITNAAMSEFIFTPGQKMKVIDNIRDVNITVDGGTEHLHFRNRLVVELDE